MHPTGHAQAAGTATPPALALRGLTKRFGDFTAVAGVDLDVPAGSFYGLVGPNGAGKTTTLSMCTGLLRPGAGQVSVFGRDVWRDPAAAKALIGVLPDGQRLFDRLTGPELLTYTGLLRRMDPAVVEQRSAELLDVLGLSAAHSTLVVDYSAGMTKKIGLACALLHAPRILLLDEPFEAVDPVSASTIREILAGYVRSGATVVMSSHAMGLVETVCDHVAVMVAGQVRAAGPVEDVRAGRSLEEVFLDLAGGVRSSGEELSWLRSSRG
jgi:ABC-2 type transport system ATP-binding protein